MLGVVSLPASAVRITDMARSEGSSVACQDRGWRGRSVPRYRSGLELGRGDCCQARWAYARECWPVCLFPGLGWNRGIDVAARLAGLLLGSVSGHV